MHDRTNLALPCPLPCLWLVVKGRKHRRYRLTAYRPQWKNKKDFFCLFLWNWWLLALTSHVRPVRRTWGGLLHSLLQNIHTQPVNVLFTSADNSWMCVCVCVSECVTWQAHLKGELTSSLKKAKLTLIAFIRETWPSAEESWHKRWHLCCSMLNI